MIAGRCIGAALVLLLACGPRSTAAPDGDATSEEVAADAAERRGATDVAAAWRGRAFVRAPTIARMDAWVDALVAGGEASRAREGLAEAMKAALAGREFELYNACARRLRGLPAAREEAIAVTELSPALTAAYTEEAAGNWRAAATAFAAAGSDAPVHLARAGEVHAELGDMDGARRRWAAARAGFHARGAALELVPVQWRGSAAGWFGEALTSWVWGMALDADRRSPRFAVLRGVGARGLAVIGAYEVVAFTADGREFVVAEGRRLVVRDVLSGLLRREIGEVDEVPGTILTSGTGEELRVLASGAPTTLWDRHGRLLASFPLPPDGVDPSATASAVAMTEGATQVAVGGHSGAVRVFAGGQSVTLTELRTPDRNSVRALGFDGEGRLVAVHDRGDLVGWDARSGAKLWHHALCSRGRDACPQLGRASVSADASRVVFGPHDGVYSEVSAADGRILRRLGDDTVAVSEVMHSSAGAVALVGNAETVWRPGAATPEVRPSSARRRSHGTWVSRDGRVLYGPLSRSDPGADVVWDVVAGRRLPVTRGEQERIVAMREDGRRAAVRMATGIEVRDTDTGAVVVAVAVAGGVVDVFLPASGHVVVRYKRDRQWVIVQPDGERSVYAIGDEVLAVSADGRWIASEGPGPDGVLAVNVRRLAAPDEVVHVLGFHADELVFTRDGTRVAWLERPSRPTGRSTVHVRSLVGEPAPAKVSVWEWATGLAFGGDEREVWFIAAEWWMRWQPETGALTEVFLPGGPVRRVTSDGRMIQVRGIAQTRLFRMGSRPLEIGQLVALDSGEWLAVSAAGAIDGSPGAIDSVVTWVQQGSTDMVFDGRLGWDAAHVDGLAGRILAGEDVAPPVRMRRPTRR